jgi:hypothetical protein
MLMAAVGDVAAAAPQHAPGVIYTMLPDLPGIEMFRCDRWRATMSVANCAARWQQQRNAAVEDRSACYGCATGACHAGEEPARRSRIFSWPICPRCRRLTMRRMIGNRRCINCFNREREWRIGRNSKGRPPRKLRLVPARLGLVLDPGGAGERYLEIAEPAVRDVVELAIAALRVVDGAVAFCRPREDAPAMTIAELAGMFAAKPTRLSGDDRRAADIVRRHRRSRKRDAVTPPAARAA